MHTLKTFLGALVLSLALPLAVLAQPDTDKITPWSALSNVKMKGDDDPFGSFPEVATPVFGASVKKMEGQTILMSGFIVPFEGLFKPKHIIISALPPAACYFCGVGGPETVAEAMLSKPITYTEKPVLIRGRLKLNTDDITRLIYILEDAEFLGYYQPNKK